MGGFVSVSTTVGVFYAADFLGGVLIMLDSCNLGYSSNAVYVPGYRVKLKTGDMDDNTLVKVEE